MNDYLIGKIRSGIERHRSAVGIDNEYYQLAHTHLAEYLPLYLEECSGWISVKKRLPDNDRYVLVCTKTAKGMKNIKTGYYLADGHGWVVGMNSNVTPGWNFRNHMKEKKMKIKIVEFDASAKDLEANKTLVNRFVDWLCGIAEQSVPGGKDEEDPDAEEE